jgi:hypothetical protein
MVTHKALRAPNWHRRLRAESLHVCRRRQKTRLVVTDEQVSNELLHARKSGLDLMADGAAPVVA